MKLSTAGQLSTHRWGKSARARCSAGQCHGQEMALRPLYNDTVPLVCWGPVELLPPLVGTFFPTLEKRLSLPFILLYRADIPITSHKENR